MSLWREAFEYDVAAEVAMSDTPDEPRYPLWASPIWTRGQHGYIALSWGVLDASGDPAKHDGKWRRILTTADVTFYSDAPDLNWRGFVCRSSYAEERPSGGFRVEGQTITPFQYTRQELEEHEIAALCDALNEEYPDEEQKRTPEHLAPEALIDALADAARFWTPPAGDRV